MSAFFALICLVVALTGCGGTDEASSPSERIRGQQEALFDVVYGQYKILIYGLPVSMEYPRLLRQRYGIDMQLRGCVVTDLELAYAHGYNGVSKEAAKRKFGQDIFEKTFADAMKLKPSTRPRRDKHAPIILHIEDISGLSLVTRDSLS